MRKPHIRLQCFGKDAWSATYYDWRLRSMYFTGLHSDAASVISCIQRGEYLSGSSF